MMEVVFNIPHDEVKDVLIRYLDTIESTDFSFKFNEDSFYKFIENDMDELDKQAERFGI